MSDLDERNLPEGVLRGVDLSKRYGETVALANVNLTLRSGRVLGLVGENGAGKSTLLNILSGIVAPDSGALEVQGTTRSISSYAEAQRLGISRVFQEQALIPGIPIFENLLLGCEAQFSRLGQFLRRRDMIDQAAAMVTAAGIQIDITKLTSDLSFSERQMIEVIRACMAPTQLFGIESPFVLLDEPTASLEKGDESRFFALLESVRRSGAVLFVSHRLTEVLRVSDEIIVLKDGHCVACVDPKEVDERELHRLMVGRERDTDYYHESDQLNRSTGRIAFAVRRRRD